MKAGDKAWCGWCGTDLPPKHSRHYCNDVCAHDAERDRQARRYAEKRAHILQQHRDRYLRRRAELQRREVIAP